MKRVRQIEVGTYSHYDQDVGIPLNRLCLFALCEDGSLWMMRDPNGDERSEFWTQLALPDDDHLNP